MSNWSKYKQYSFDWLVDFCKSNAIYELDKFLKISPFGTVLLKKLLRESNIHSWRNFRKNFLDGKAAWNSGLTVKTDSRVNAYNEKQKITWNKKTDDEKKLRNNNISVATKNAMKDPRIREILSRVNSGANHRLYGKKQKEETKRKQRIAKINYWKNNGGLKTLVGLNEKQLLDKQEQIDECKIIRQYEISKLGYVVDGYCIETNKIYEVYEKAHDKKIFEDLEREIRICNHLSCEFHIIWDRTH